MREIRVPSAVFVLRGEYDVSHRWRLRAELEALADAPDLVLDMSAVTYMDSICIVELLRVWSLRKRKGLPAFSLVRGAPSLARSFALAGLESAFRIVDALDEVLAKDGRAVDVRYATPGDESAVKLSSVLAGGDSGTVEE